MYCNDFYDFYFRDSIQWNEGKNVTKKVIKKKQKKGANAGKFLTKTVISYFEM